MFRTRRTPPARRQSDFSSTSSFRSTSYRTAPRQLDDVPGFGRLLCLPVGVARDVVTFRGAAGADVPDVAASGEAAGADVPAGAPTASGETGSWAHPSGISARISA